MQEVPVGQMAQGTPPQRTPRPSKVASNGFINFSKCQVKSFQNHLPSWALYCSYRAPSRASFKLSQLLNVSKGDFPMALFPDPTTAASERSSGSGINRHRSRTFSKTSLRGHQAQVQAHPESLGGVQAVQGGAGEVSGGCRARGSATSRKTRKIRQTFRSCMSSLTRSCIQDCVQEVAVGQMAQGTPPSAHAAAFQGGFKRLHQLLQVSSEVFSKSSSVMGSLLFL